MEAQKRLTIDRSLVLLWGIAISLEYIHCIYIEQQGKAFMRDTVGRVTAGWFECPYCNHNVAIKGSNILNIRCPECRRSWEFGLWIRVPVPGRHRRLPMVRVLPQS